MRFKSKNRWKSSGGRYLYKKWRNMVMELNKGKHGLLKHYICQKCKCKRKTTRSLHSHHIFSWKKYPKLRYESKNGVVLCKKCHMSFHTKYKYNALSNPILLSEWLGDDNKKDVRSYIEENKKSIKL